MNYEEAIRYIKETAKFGSKYGLERTEKLLEFLGNPHKKIKTIHVAGTNGKGSTTAMLTSILMDSGYDVGTYISPYIEEFEERIQINRKNIPKDDLCYIVSKVKEAVEKVCECGYGNPTEFEIITCCGFLYFYNKNVDFVVVEVGLGGRLDSTNVINPILSIIGSISYDHTQILGDTIEKIAYEKAGIIKENTPIVLFPQKREVELVVESVAKDKNAPLIKVPKDIAKFDKVITIDEEKNLAQHILINDDMLQEYDLALLGTHQISNSTVVIYAAKELIKLGVNISKKNIKEGLKKVKWPARLEIMNNNPMVVIDGAHNIDGIKKLDESIKKYFNYKKMVLILGILADKQVKDMVEVIAPNAYKVICVTPNSERAELATELKKEIDMLSIDCEAIKTYDKAYEKALSYCENEDLLLVSGSLYMIGDMRKIIRNFK